MKRSVVFVIFSMLFVSFVIAVRAQESSNWLTYSGSPMGQRYSPLAEVTPANVQNLELKWMMQNQVFGPWETSPLVVDGVMYLTQRPNDVMALDAKTGRMFWLYRYTNSGRQTVCCGIRAILVSGKTSAPRPLWSKRPSRWARKNPLHRGSSRSAIATG